MKTDIPVYCSYTDMVPIADLEKMVNPRNPNSHPYDQVSLLSKILIKNGWRAPITISKRSGLIIRGHGRLQGAKKAGCSKAPVDYQEYASEKDEMADMIADNRIQQQSILDLSECLEIIDDFNLGDFDCEQFGFLLEDYENYTGISNAFDAPDRYQKPEKKEESNETQGENQGESHTEKPKEESRGPVYCICPQCGCEIRKGEIK